MDKFGAADVNEGWKTWSNGMKRDALGAILQGCKGELGATMAQLNAMISSQSDAAALAAGTGGAGSAGGWCCRFCGHAPVPVAKNNCSACGRARQVLSSYELRARKRDKEEAAKAAKRAELNKQRDEDLARQLMEEEMDAERRRAMQVRHSPAGGCRLCVSRPTAPLPGLFAACHTVRHCVLLVRSPTVAMTPQDSAIARQIQLNQWDEQEAEEDLALAAAAARIGEDGDYGDEGEDAEGKDAAVKCSVCLVKVANATLMHGITGHTCCCMPCARVLEQHCLPCPLCREPIAQVVMDANWQKAAEAQQTKGAAVKKRTRKKKGKKILGM